MKKSQLYVFAGIILVLSIFALTSRSSIFIKSTKADSSYLENYYYEAINVLNYAIAREENATSALINYTESFLDYKKDIYVAFIYAKGGKVYLANYLDEAVYLNEVSINKKSIYEADIQEFDLIYKKNTYHFNFSYPNEIKILFVKDNLIYIK